MTAPTSISTFSTVLMSLCKKVELQEVVWPLEFGPGSPQQLERLSTLLQVLKGYNFKNSPLKVPLEFTKPPYFNTSFWVMLVVFPHSSSYNFLLAWITTTFENYFSPQVFLLSNLFIQDGCKPFLILNTVIKKCNSKKKI